VEEAVTGAGVGSRFPRFVAAWHVRPRVVTVGTLVRALASGDVSLITMVHAADALNAVKSPSVNLGVWRRLEVGVTRLPGRDGQAYGKQSP
jgi:hypothetical protein